MALKVLDEYKKTQTAVKSFDYENSELLLYENLIYRESGRYQEALNHLKDSASQIHDILAFNEIQGETIESYS